MPHRAARPAVAERPRSLPTRAADAWAWLGRVAGGGPRSPLPRVAPLGLLAPLALLGPLGCAEPAAPTPPDAASEPPAEVDPQVPPQGAAALSAWLATGAYRAWACEPAPHAARPPGAHGMNRICSNAALSATASGAFPVGAATVKELYSGGQVTGYAVGRKLAAAGGAASWYWYERIGASTVADGVAVRLCSDCHATAAQDFIFTRVP
jgi:hypothetical protein